MVEIRQATTMDDSVYGDALAIRMQVFVEEQHVPAELEKDDGDAVATHYVGYVSGQPVVTLRTIQDGDQVHIQRVATVKKYRHHGYAALLMQRVLERMQKDPRIKGAYLGAQLTAIGFYKTLGFVAQGPEFLDAGIKHRRMALKLN